MNQGFFGFPNEKTSASFFDCWILNRKNAIRVDEFTIAGTYNKVQFPANAKYLTILAYAGGGGGQGGQVALTFSSLSASGGAGGGGGGTALVRYNLQDFPGEGFAASKIFRAPLYLQVVVGAGGAGGAGVNTNSAGSSQGGLNGGLSGGNTAINLTNSADTVLMRLAFCQGGTAGYGNPGQRPGTGGAGMNQGMGPAQFAGTVARGQTGSIVPGWNSGGARFPITFSTGSPFDIPLHPYVCGGGGAGSVINTDGTSQQTGGAGGTGYFYYEGFKSADGGTTDGTQDATLEDIVFGGVGGNGGYSATVAQARNAFRGGNGIRGGGAGGGGGCYLGKQLHVATLATGVATVTLTTGNTSTLVVGDSLVKLSGTGAFAAGATVLSIESSTAFTMSANHLTAGSINFVRNVNGTYSSGAGGTGGAGYCLLLWSE